MMLRRFLTTVAVVLPTAAGLMPSSPAAAIPVGGGGGVTIGSVNLQPGYHIPPTIPDGVQAFVFNSITTDGAFALVDPTTATAQGCASLSLHPLIQGQGSALGTIAEDNGLILPFNTTATCDVTGGVGLAYATSAAGGQFVRIGPVVVIVALGGLCTVGRLAAQCDLVVAAEFQPESLTENPLQNFSIRGTFAVATL